jgi:hypothetical protein
VGIYAAGLACALLCDLVGALTLLSSPFGAAAGFADFVAATRNEELDVLDFSERRGTGRVRLRGG